MTLRSYSKINLTLNINQKLESGLHEIQSYFSLINLYDELTIKKIKGNKDKVKFVGEFAKNVKKNNNSLLDTLKILRKEEIIKDNYSILINKKIPVFAGLGGGTSNAISLTKFFVKKKINKDLVNILSKKIGSDCKLFLHKHGFLKNLNEVNNFNMKFKMYFLLIFPNLKCSTKNIYSKVKKYTKKKKYNSIRAQNKTRFIRFLNNQRNDLQSIVEKKYPIIKRLLLQISEEKGCYFSRMSGSGSVCYGIFESEKTAIEAFNRMKLRYPNYWLSVTKTI